MKKIGIQIFWQDSRYVVIAVNHNFKDPWVSMCNLDGFVKNPKLPISKFKTL
jgi:hypothetical protein